MSRDLRQPVRVSLVFFPVDRQAMWSFRAGAGMVSASRVLRGLIRRISPETVRSMKHHFAQASEARGTFGRFARFSLLLDAADLAQLDQLAAAGGAPSRSAATRFLILTASRAGRTTAGAAQ